MNSCIRKEVSTCTILTGLISSTKNHTDYPKLKSVMVDVGTNMYKRSREVKIAVKNNVTITLNY